MKRTYIIPVLFLCLLTLSVWAQTQKTDQAQQPKHYVPVFLGNTQLSGGGVSSYTFDSLMRQGLSSDSGRVVAGFKFGYAERNIYEDSTGNLVNMVDYNSEFCSGDTLTPMIMSSLKYRLKNGDTIYFENIEVRLPAGGKAEGRPMKVFIKN